MNLARFPRRRYSPGNTPLEPLPRLSLAIGGPKLQSKRDHLLGLAGGSNKTRKTVFNLTQGNMVTAARADMMYR